MTSEDKIKRIVAKNPELKDIFLLIKEDSNLRKQLGQISEKNVNKIILVGKNSEILARLYQLSMVMSLSYPHITQVTTIDLLDLYVDRDTGTDEDTPSLSTVTDDLVMIRDSRAYVPNKQKSNMVMQVMEQNKHCIYYYVGSCKSFTNEHPLLLEYSSDSNIPIRYQKETQVTSDI